MSGAPRLGPYLSPEARTQRVRALAERADAELIEYGRSVEGEPLVAVRLPSPAPLAPRVLCSANLHGPEIVGSHVALAVLEAAADGLPAIASLRATAELWVAPCLNPDGYRRTWDRGGVGTLAELRCNARGVDLNRNFPLPLGAKPSRLPGAGSSRPGAATYRGPHPLSEPESAAIDALLAAYPMRASANLHSFMGTIIPARVTDREHFRGYARLCAAFSSAQSEVRYTRVASRHFDVFTGELEDHAHHHHGVWAACIEVFPWLASLRQHLRAPSTFWRFNPRAPERWVANDVPGIVAFLSAAIRQAPPLAATRTGS